MNDARFFYLQEPSTRGMSDKDGSNRACCFFNASNDAIASKARSPFSLSHPSSLSFKPEKHNSANLPIAASAAAAAASSTWAPRSVGAWLHSAGRPSYHHHRGGAAGAGGGNERRKSSRVSSRKKEAAAAAADASSSSPATSLSSLDAGGMPQSADLYGEGDEDEESAAAEASSSGAETSDGGKERAQPLFFGASESEFFVPPHLLVERQAFGGSKSGFPLSSSAFAGSRGSSSFVAAGASFSAAAFATVSAASAGAAPPLSCSVQFGAGRKLTGAAAARFRCDVLRQTGFLEPGQPGSVAAERSAPEALAKATSPPLATSLSAPAAGPALLSSSPRSRVLAAAPESLV